MKYCWPCGPEGHEAWIEVKGNTLIVISENEQIGLSIHVSKDRLSIFAATEGMDLDVGTVRISETDGTLQLFPID